MSRLAEDISKQTSPSSGDSFSDPFSRSNLLQRSPPPSSTNQTNPPPVVRKSTRNRIEVDYKQLQQGKGVVPKAPELGEKDSSRPRSPISATAQVPTTTNEEESHQRQTSPSSEVLPPVQKAAAAVEEVNQPIDLDPSILSYQLIDLVHPDLRQPPILSPPTMAMSQEDLATLIGRCLQEPPKAGPRDFSSVAKFDNKSMSFTEHMAMMNRLFKIKGVDKDLKVACLLETIDTKLLAWIVSQDKNNELDKDIGDVTEFIKLKCPDRYDQRQKRQILKALRQKETETVQEYLDRKRDRAQELAYEQNDSFFEDLVEGLWNPTLRSEMRIYIRTARDYSDFETHLRAHAEEIEKKSRPTTSIVHRPLTPHRSSRDSPGRDNSSTPSTPQTPKGAAGGRNVSFTNDKRRSRSMERDRPKRRSKSTSGERKVKCYNCGVEGHYANNCPGVPAVRMVMDPSYGHEFPGHGYPVFRQASPYGRSVSPNWQPVYTPQPAPYYTPFYHPPAGYDETPATYYRNSFQHPTPASPMIYQEPFAPTIGLMPLEQRYPGHEIPPACSPTANAPSPMAAPAPQQVTGPENYHHRLPPGQTPMGNVVTHPQQRVMQRYSPNPSANR